MSKVTVNAGICKFSAVITGEENEDGLIDLNFKTTCPNFKKLEGDYELDPMVCCFQKIGEGEIFEMFKPCCPHITCPIPTAVLKCIEVSANLALPCDVTMKIQ